MATTESPVTKVDNQVGSRAGWTFLSITRIVIGFYFLWAFFDKLIGLGFSTCKGEEGVAVMCERAWLSGGRITEGYLGSSTGPMADFFATMGTWAWTDWPFMLGLAGIGIALMLGIGTRIGMVSATAMLLLMYLSHGWPFIGNATNPIIDSHIVMAVAVIAVVLMEVSRQSIGLGNWWRKLDIVQKNRWLI